MHGPTGTLSKRTSHSRRGLSAIAIALVLALPGAASAADQIRLKVTNNSGFVISSLTLHKRYWSTALDRNETNFTAGASKSVKWSVTKKWSWLDVVFDYGIVAMPRGTCSKSVDLKIDQATQQITNVILPNGTELTTSNKLNNNKDQIVRVNFSITGTPGHSACKFKGVNVSNR